MTTQHSVDVTILAEMLAERASPLLRVDLMQICRKVLANAENESDEFLDVADALLGAIKETVSPQ